MTTTQGSTTRERILDAARTCLLTTGYADLSTRAIADTAGVPLSQIHYHFGGKQPLVLALLDHENERLLERQHRMYGGDAPLWKRWEQACDFLDEDLESGYVGVLQQMIAAGWTDPDIAERVRRDLTGWYVLLRDVTSELERRGGSLGPMTAAETSTLVGMLFMGAESMILLGYGEEDIPMRAALRRVGDLIRMTEEGAGD